MLTKIDRFSKEYSFLSNFYPCGIEYCGVFYPSVEHAYQAAKCKDSEVKLTIACAETPSLAKKIGKNVDIIEDWDNKKVDIMRDLLQIKFSYTDLKEKLKSTGDKELIEGNCWKDTF